MRKSRYTESQFWGITARNENEVSKKPVRVFANHVPSF
jgi:hypothetical protein